MAAHRASANAGAPALSAAALRGALLSRLEDTSLPRVIVALTAACDEDPAIRRWLVELERDNKARLVQALADASIHVSSDDIDLFHATFVGASLLALQAGTQVVARRQAALVGRAWDQLLAHSAKNGASST